MDVFDKYIVMGKNKRKQSITPIQKLLKKPMVSSKDFRENGYPPGLLRYYEKKGFIKRVERGLYVNNQNPPDIEFKYEDLVYVVLSIPNGVITGISALDIYDFTDEISRFHWIAVPHGTSIGPRRLATIIHTRNPNIGLTSIKLGDISVPIYEPERVLVDAFKLTDRETAIKSLREAFRAGKKRMNINKLVDYSKKLRTNIIPYLETITTV